MKASVLMIFCAVLMFPVNAQKPSTKSKKAIAHYQKAKNLLMKNEIELALQSLDKALDQDDQFIDAYLVKADVYNSLDDFYSEKELLKKALEIDSTYFIRSYYNLGIAQYNTGFYQEAAISLFKYREKTNDPAQRKKAKFWMERARFADYALANPVDIDPVSLGASVNSRYDEYWPSLRGDEQELVFTVLVPRDTAAFLANPKLPKTPGYFHEDFFRSTKKGSWQSREKLGAPINTDSNEGAQTLSADGSWMFFTACGRPDSKGGCDIYFSRRTELGWSRPINIDAPVNTPYWESQPSFSADGKTLYFVSNRSGGKGKRDLWKSEIVSFRNNGAPVFGRVVNLGDSINTFEDENSPFIHPDGQTLYFSSYGWPGLGRMDIFMSRKNSDGSWGLPENLGYPINTSGDEISLILNPQGDKAYFSSDRFGGAQTGKDIYMFEMPKDIRPNPVSYVKGIVYDQETKRRLGASFELISLASGELVVASQSSEFSGEFLVCLPSGSNYALNVSKEGYLFYSGNFNLSKGSSRNKPKEMNIYLQPIKSGVTTVLENIFFESGKYDLLPESLVELDKLVVFLSQNTEVKIEVSGHTDNVGDKHYNVTLSENRAKAVYQFLLSKNIAASRISFKGYGEIKPVAGNTTEEDRAKNRRTEIKIL